MSENESMMNTGNRVSHNQEQSGVNKGNAPIETLRDGHLKLAIFKNEREKGASYAMEAGRIYTDQQGQVREAKSLNAQEALRMSRLLEKGYDRVAEFRKEQQQQQTQSPERER